MKTFTQRNILKGEKFNPSIHRLSLDNIQKVRRIQTRLSISYEEAANKLNDYEQIINNTKRIISKKVKVKKVFGKQPVYSNFTTQDRKNWILNNLNVDETSILWNEIEQRYVDSQEEFDKFIDQLNEEYLYEIKNQD